MPTEKQPTAMQRSDDDITTDSLWEQEQSDRLLAYEILRRSLLGDHHPIEPADLGDLAAMDKGAPFRILERIKASLNGQ